MAPPSPPLLWSHRIFALVPWDPARNPRIPSALAAARRGHLIGTAHAFPAHSAAVALGVSALPSWWPYSPHLLPKRPREERDRLSGGVGGVTRLRGQWGSLSFQMQSVLNCRDRRQRSVPASKPSALALSRLPGCARPAPTLGAWFLPASLSGRAMRRRRWWPPPLRPCS